MPHINADRVREITTSTGTGAIAVSGVPDATFQSFDDVLGIGDTIYYEINQLEEGLDEWEVGLATYTGLNTLTRTTVYDSSNGGLAVNFSAGEKEVLGVFPAQALQDLQDAAAGTEREILTADRIYYIRTDGSDSNDGLANTAGGAWASLTHAWKHICSTVDLAGHGVTVQIADGTYSGGFSTYGDVTGPDSAYGAAYVPVGGGKVMFKGNTSTPANVVIQAAPASAYAGFWLAHSIDTNLTLWGMTITGDFPVYLSGGSVLFLSLASVVFSGGSSGTACFIGSGSYNVYLSACQISGNYRALVEAVAYGFCSVYNQVYTGTPVFAAANIMANNGAQIAYSSPTGAATGKRFIAASNAIIDAGGSLTAIPGSVAGTIDSGAQYIGAGEDLWTVGLDGALTIPTTVTVADDAYSATTWDGNLSVPTKNAVRDLVVANVREKLSAARTYYVRTDGSDSNTGLVNNAGGAFLTVQKAWDVVCGTLDQGIYAVTIQVAAGTYVGGLNGTIAHPTGVVSLLGDPTTPSNVVISHSGANANIFDFQNINEGSLTVNGFQFTHGSNGMFAIKATAVPNLIVNNIIVNAAGRTNSTAIYCNASVLFMLGGNVTLAGGFRNGFIFTLNASGTIFPSTLTLTSVPSFSASGAFLQAYYSYVEYFDYGRTGTATGKPYYARSNGIIETFGQAPPGSIPGEVENFGFYGGAQQDTWTIAEDGGLTLPTSLALSGDISPAQITSNQNDYNPTGLSGASRLRLTTDASRNLTSLAGGADGRVIVISNVGSFPIVLKDDDGATGTAANRFALAFDITLDADEGATFIYDSTSLRWRCIGISQGVTGRETLTAARTYYIRTDGSDNNSGLVNSSGGAFATIQKAWDVVCNTLQQNGYTVTIQFVDGTYTSNTQLLNSGATVAPMPTGPITIKGNTTTPANVVLTFTGLSFATAWQFIGDLYPLRIEGFKIAGGMTSATVFRAYSMKDMTFGKMIFDCSHASFTACNLVIVNDSSVSVFGSTWQIIGGSGSIQTAFYAQGYSTGYFEPTLTLTSTPAFSVALLVAADYSKMVYYDYGTTGTCTGKQFTVFNNSVLTNYGGTIPGSITGTVEDALSMVVGSYIDSWDIVADGGLTLPASLRLAGDISPAQITSNQNDYNPTGLAGAARLRLNTDASRNLTSLAGGADGRVIVITNVGSFPLIIKDDDGSTGTAANRFALAFDIGLGPDEGATFLYDSTSSRWRCIGISQGVTGRELLTAARTYYVRTDGSDANTGLANTSGGAFLTIGHAWDVVCGTLDQGIYTVRIQVADGTYSGTANAVDGLTKRPTGNVEIYGNTSTPANVNISIATAAYTFFIFDAIPYSIVINGFKLTAGANTMTGFNAQNSCTSVTATNIIFVGTGFNNLRVVNCNGWSGFYVVGAWTVTGGTYNVAFYWFSMAVGTMFPNLTLTGTPTAVIAFFAANDNSSVGHYLYGLSGSITGPNYLVRTSRVFIYAIPISYGGSAGTVEKFGVIDGTYQDLWTIAATGALTLPSTLSVGGVTTPSIRERLTANRTYYIRTDGNDANTGLANTSGGAWLTLQHAWDVITGTIDQGIYTVTVQVGAGTYSAQTLDSVGIPTGPVIFNGDTTTPSNVVLTISASIPIRFQNLTSPLTFRGFQLTYGANNVFAVVLNRCASVIIDHIYWNATGRTGARGIFSDYSTVTCGGLQQFAGGFFRALTFRNFSWGSFSPNPITLTSTPTWSSCFIDVESYSNVTYYQYGTSGSATGARYILDDHARLQTFGQTLPGNSNGTVDDMSVLSGSYHDLWTVGSDGALSGNQRLVTPDNDGRTVTTAEGSVVFTNEGATAIAPFVLPTAVANLTYSFVVQDADGIRVTAAAGDTINIAGAVSAAAGKAESTTIGASLTLVAINATEWVATAALGTWVVT